MKKIAFIIHGKLSAQSKLQQDVLAAFRPGYELAFYLTERPGHATELTLRAIESGYTYIICCGGDGSLNECANGVMKAGAKAADVQLGVLPYGTGNDFIKTVQSPKTVAALKQAIDNGGKKLIDLGHAWYTGTDGQPVARYFINITDVGMGGVVAEKLSRSKKMFGSTVTYQYNIITTFFTYDKQPVTVQADTFTYEGRVMNFVVANGIWFGSGLGVSPDSDVTDGLLNVIVLGDVGTADYFKNLSKVKKAEKVMHPEVKYMTARELTVQSSIGPISIDMDGEFVGYSPLKIKAVHKALWFITG